MAKYFVQLEETALEAPLTGSKVTNHVIRTDPATLVIECCNGNAGSYFKIVYSQKLSNSEYNDLIDLLGE